MRESNGSSDSQIDFDDGLHEILVEEYKKVVFA